MASFTDEVLRPVGTPNMTGASKGTGADRSFEALFSGLGETLSNVAQVRDTATQLQIQDEATQMFEQTNQDFGVDAPPPGMQDSVDRMATLQAAFEQGKINETNYYGRLATLSKQMRSKYPGYERIVDSTIQSVTGTRPANAFRDALFAQIKDAQQSASDEVKFRRQYEKENEGEIAALFGEDYFDDPNNYDFSEVRAKVSGFKGKRELIDAENKELEAMSKRGEFNDKRAKRTIDQDFAFVSNSIMNRALRLNDKGAMASINDFIARGGGSAQETEAFINQVTELEASTRAALTQKGLERYVATGLVSRDDMNKSIDEALYPITKAKEAVLGGDFKLASKYATLNKVATDQQVDQMMNADPRFRAGKGLEEISRTLGEDFWIGKTDELSNIAVDIAGQAAAGRQDAINEAVKTGNDKVVKRTLETSLDVIRNPQATPDQINNIAGQFFGPNATKWMDPSIVAPDDRERLYKTFLNPQVTKSIFEKGSDDLKQQYLEWAVTQAPSIVSFKAAAGDVNSFQSMGMKVDMDPKTGRLSLGNDPMTKRGPGTGAMMMGFADRLIRGKFNSALKSMNEVLSVLDPIAEAAGIDRGQFARQVIQQMGVQLQDTNFKEGGDNQGFFGSVYDALNTPMATGAQMKGLGPQSSIVDTAPVQLASFSEDQGVSDEDWDTISLDDVEFLTEQEDKEVVATLNDEFEGDSIEPSTFNKLPRREKASYIRQGLEARGLPAHVADAFVMNFADESGLNSAINERKPLVKGSRGGYGLYQLTGPRRREYEAYAKRRGVPPSSVDAQLDFLIHELKGKEALAFRSIMKRNTTGSAAVAIVKDFLRPAKSHQNSRSRRYLRAAG